MGPHRKPMDFGPPLTGTVELRTYNAVLDFSDDVRPEIVAGIQERADAVLKQVDDWEVVSGHVEPK